MGSINKFVINFILPIIVLILAFKFNFLVGILLIAGFLTYVLFKSRSDIYANVGNIQYMKGNYDKANYWVGKAVKVKGCKPNTTIAYAFLKIRDEKLDEAERLLEGVINSGAYKDDKNKAKTTLALVFWKKGRLYHAINSLEQIYVDYKHTNLYAYLGFLYIVKGDLEKALEFNKEAYEYNSTNQYIMNNLAQTNYLLGNYEDADNLFKSLVERNPMFLEAYYYYGLIKLQLEEKEEGLALLRKSLNYKNSVLTNITAEDVKIKLAELGN